MTAFTSISKHLVTIKAVKFTTSTTPELFIYGRAFPVTLQVHNMGVCIGYEDEDVRYPVHSPHCLFLTERKEKRCQRCAFSRRQMKKLRSEKNKETKQN